MASSALKTLRNKYNLKSSSGQIKLSLVVAGIVVGCVMLVMAPPRWLLSLVPVELGNGPKGLLGKASRLHSNFN